MTEENKAAGQKPPSMLTGEVGKILPGTQPEMVNGLVDCPTILVDGFNGVSVGEHITKIHFVEHMPAGEKLLGRHVVTVALPNDQLARIAATFGEVVTKIAELRATEGKK